jgi:hypothetical protein
MNKGFDSIITEDDGVHNGLTSTLSIAGLRDLLDALAPQIEALPGLAWLWGAELAQALDDALVGLPKGIRRGDDC